MSWNIIQLLEELPRINPCFQEDRLRDICKRTPVKAAPLYPEPSVDVLAVLRTIREYKDQLTESASGAFTTDPHITMLSAPLIQSLCQYLAACHAALELQNNPDDPSAVLRTYLSCWNEERHDVPSQKETSRFDQGTGALFALFNEAGWSTGEAQDLLLSWQGQNPRLADHTISMRVLLVEGGTGFLGTLTLEWVPFADKTRESQPASFVRHPDIFLLPRDTLCQQSLDNSIHWANKQEWARSGGEVRWDLALLDPHKPLSAVTGNSLGGALAVGLYLLWNHMDSDLSISITAAITPEGIVSPVGGVIPKLESALDTWLLTPIHKVILSGDQAEYKSFGQASPGRYVLADNAQKAIQVFQREIAPRRAVREKIQTDSERLPSLIEDTGTDRPIGDAYIVLPLLQEIERKKIDELKLGAGSPSGSEGPSKDEDRLHLSRILQWEEEVAREYVTREPVDISKILENKRHFVVIGPPGSGKSSFLQYIAWRASAQEKALFSDSRAVLPIVIGLKEWESSKSDLSPFLTNRYEALDDRPTHDQWVNWRKRGELLLLLDGLDEVNEPFLAKVAQEVNDWKDTCRVVITCRTITRHRLDKIASGFPVFAPSPFSYREQEKYLNSYPAHSFDPAALLKEIQRPDIQLLATNPLLLSIFCFVANSKSGERLPETRTKLYNVAVDEILKNMNSRPRNPEVHFKEMNSEKREVLEQLALDMFCLTERFGVGSDEEINKIYQRIWQKIQSKWGITPGGIAENTVRSLNASLPGKQLFSDLSENSRLFVGNPTIGYSFLHRTFQEFLAASALARHRTEEWKIITVWSSENWKQAFQRIDRAFRAANYDRAEAEKKLSHAECLVALLDHKAWLDEWHEVFRFLTGLLPEPSPLLELLSDAHLSRDDQFRHRLALAADCLQDIAPSLRTPASTAL